MVPLLRTGGNLSGIGRTTHGHITYMLSLVYVVDTGRRPLPELRRGCSERLAYDVASSRPMSQLSHEAKHDVVRPQSSLEMYVRCTCVSFTVV